LYETYEIRNPRAKRIQMTLYEIVLVPCIFYVEDACFNFCQSENDPNLSNLVLPPVEQGHPPFRLVELMIDSDVTQEEVAVYQSNYPDRVLLWD